VQTTSIHLSVCGSKRLPDIYELYIFTFFFRNSCRACVTFVKISAVAYFTYGVNLFLSAVLKFIDQFVETLVY